MLSGQTFFMYIVIICFDVTMTFDLFAKLCLAKVRTKHHHGLREKVIKGESEIERDISRQRERDGKIVCVRARACVCV